MLLSFLTYASTSHDLVHRNLKLPGWLNEALLSAVELLAFRSGHACSPRGSLPRETSSTHLAPAWVGALIYLASLVRVQESPEIQTMQMTWADKIEAKGRKD